MAIKSLKNVIFIPMNTLVETIVNPNLFKIRKRVKVGLRRPWLRYSGGIVKQKTNNGDQAVI